VEEPSYPGERRRAMKATLLGLTLGVVLAVFARWKFRESDR
jgi:hypothetical protein